MENNQCGLWKTLRQRLGKQPQTEEVRSAVEFERTLRNLEARLHESDNADDIISRTLSTACDFYNANWAGFLEIDMDLGVWAPYVWFNTNPHDRTKELVRDFEEIAIMQRWLAAIGKIGKQVRESDIRTILYLPGANLRFFLQSGNTQ